MEVDQGEGALGKHAREGVGPAGAALKKVHVDTNAVTMKGVEDDFESLLRFYYGYSRVVQEKGQGTDSRAAAGKVFPFAKMWKWLSYSNSTPLFTQTSLAVTLCPVGFSAQNGDLIFAL
jgi:hypothetical protein